MRAITSFWAYLGNGSVFALTEAVADDHLDGRARYDQIRLSVDGF